MKGMRLEMKVSVALITMAVVQGVVAEQFAFVGARAGGMGGANSASSHDASAQWHNPAVFGFMSQKPEEVEAAATNNTDVVAETNEVIAAVSTTNAVAESATDTNEVGTVSMDNILAAMENGEAHGAVGEPLGSEVLEKEPVDETGYNLLDNNGLSDRGFGWNLIGAGVGYTMTEDMGHYIGMLSDVNVDAFDTPGLSTDPDAVPMG